MNEPLGFVCEGKHFAISGCLIYLYSFNNSHLKLLCLLVISCCVGSCPYPLHCIRIPASCILIMWSDCINVHYGYFPWRLFLPSTFYPNNHSNSASGRHDPRINLRTNQCDIWDTMLKHAFALGVVCHCAYPSIISTGFISALLNRSDEMVNILGSCCSGLHHHLKDSMGDLSLSLIHSPLQAAHTLV